MMIPRAKPQRPDLTAPPAKMGEPRQGIIAFIDKNRRALSALLVFAAMMLVFIILGPSTFLNPLIYMAIFRTLPIPIILTSSLVFVIVEGEIDLSFGSIVGLTTWAFAATAVAGWNPFLSMVFALVVGGCTGFLNGVIVTRLGLSSLVSTLGMSFLLRGLIHVGTQGNGISLTFLNDTPFYNASVGSVWGFPVHMIWGLAFAAVAMLLFNYHRIGAHICCVGDNPESSREMGINVAGVKTLAFIYVGIASGMAGVLSGLNNQMFYPGSGEDLLMPVLAATFVGGTPTWGGVGTVVGAVIGACSVGVIEAGIVAAGVSHLYKNFFYGLIIILAVSGHRLNEPQSRI